MKLVNKFIIICNNENEFYEQVIDHTQDILESYTFLKDYIKKEQKIEGGKFAGINFCFTGV